MKRSCQSCDLKFICRLYNSINDAVLIQVSANTLLVNGRNESTKIVEPKSSFHDIFRATAQSCSMFKSESYQKFLSTINPNKLNVIRQIIKIIRKNENYLDILLNSISLEQRIDECQLLIEETISENSSVQRILKYEDNFEYVNLYILEKLGIC